jgi:MEDS: MEthanogen/methylotroph, DcmR Sensory domain
VPFIEEGLRRREPVFVLMDEDRWAHVRAALGGDGALPFYLAAGSVGRNPARLLPRLEELFSPHVRSGSPVRAATEPAWPGRPDHELAECTQHDRLLNLAFAYTAGSLHYVRRRALAEANDLDADRVDDLLMAAGEALAKPRP